MLKPGDVAPHFRLFSDEKKPVSLKDFEGHTVVLLFFPLAFTGTCTTEMCMVRDNFGFYEKLDAHVLGISIDTPMSLAHYRAMHHLNFSFLSDFNLEASRAYDCFYEEFILEMRGVSKRGAFVIDGKGIIRYAEVLDDASKIPNFEAIDSVITSLKE